MRTKLPGERGGCGALELYMKKGGYWALHREKEGKQKSKLLKGLRIGLVNGLVMALFSLLWRDSK